MIKSMTAFSSSDIEIDNFTIVCELRSVNHRYCDISLKLPELIRYCEPEIRSSITSSLKRGKIECSLRYSHRLTDKQPIIINEQAVKALLQATSQIEEHMHTQQPISALEVLKYLTTQLQPEINKKTLLLGVIDLVESSLKQLLTSREKEGAQLAILIKERCLQSAELVTLAKERLPVVLKQIQTKIKTRLAELDVEPDFDRLEQEMVYLTQKLDIAEELDRLDTHIQEVLSILTRNEVVGRRLDFLMQEMNREANTLGSKSADIETTKISIELKVLIEQMREQIQNIE
jgi:uncharacterized protein (TIGR00255 family)